MYTRKAIFFSILPIKVVAKDANKEFKILFMHTKHLHMYIYKSAVLISPITAPFE